MTAHAVPGAVDDAWDTPQYIGSAWEVGKSRDPITLMPDMEFWLLPKHKPANADKEAVIVAYVARIINQNGGYFCATQVRARNQNKGTLYNDSWTIYQVPGGDSEKTCFWLCEPGYTGENCKKVDAANPANTEDICAYTRLSVENLSQFVSYNETGGKEEKSVEGAMTQNDYQGFFRFGHECKSRRCEADTILAAKSYLSNGHGIVASPATVTAHAIEGNWSESDYAFKENQRYFYDSAQADLQITDNGANYTTKTLCMPGFYGPGCTTTICTECDDTLARFNADTGYCSDCIENHVHDESGACVPCADGSYKHPDRDECITCANTEYFDATDGECKPKAIISKESMYKCYTNEDITDFQACVSDTCENGLTVECITDDNGVGKKTCVNKRWSRCSHSGDTIINASPQKLLISPTINVNSVQSLNN